VKSTVLCGLHEVIYPCGFIVKSRRLLGDYSKAFFQNAFLTLDIISYLQNIMVKLVLIVSVFF
jgi:hypothetical protein